jgi:hypothetical protein
VCVGLGWGRGPACGRGGWRRPRGVGSRVHRLGGWPGCMHRRVCRRGHGRSSSSSSGSSGSGSTRRRGLGRGWRASPTAVERRGGTLTLTTVIVVPARSMPARLGPLVFLAAAIQWPRVPSVNTATRKGHLHILYTHTPTPHFLTQSVCACKREGLEKRRHRKRVCLCLCVHVCMNVCMCVRTYVASVCMYACACVLF